MSLEERVAKELVAAMKAKDDAALRSLRAIKAQILLHKTSGKHEDLDSAAEIKLLQKLVKQRRESLAIYEEQGREDLATVEREEIEVISTFLPEQLDEKKLREMAAEIVSATGATGMQDMGRVMGQLNAKVAGRADGKTVAGIVKELLSNKS